MIMGVEILSQKNNNFLYIDDYLWMWDIPAELELQEEISKQSYGKVLVVGYGLGIVQKYLLKNKKVTSVLTVEINKEIISENLNKFKHIYGDIIISNFYDDFCKENKFDCVIGDIWPEISSKYLKNYIDFKERANIFLKKNGKILAWGSEYYEFLIKKENK